ncbi:MAG: TIGR01777 family oxidoreductase [Oligoflexia bacterium]|nr:TIGR01777 family oxidoreductase [Oligoflexia bacterium]
MKILLTGATGFIGRKLAIQLSKDGHDLVLLSRDPERASLQVGVECQIFKCDLALSEPPTEALSNIDAVIHLAGESVASGRWTLSRKQKIYDSRIKSTRNLVNSFKSVGVQAPKLFLAASAIGFYGDRGDEVLSENSVKGIGFLADLCNEWEAESNRAKGKDTRVVTLRLGVVFGEGGGALTQMLRPFTAGLGAKLGSGKQWMSWIHLEDVVGAICFILKNENIIGPVNGVSEEPITNSEFTQVLAGVLKTKARLTLPAIALGIALGEMSSVVLGSSKVISSQLKSHGFKFTYPHLHKALSGILNSNLAN